MRISWLAYIVVLCCFSLPSVASLDKSDDSFLRARTLYQQRQLNELKQVADKLESEQYLLTPYVRYWQLLLNLNETQDADFESFSQKYSDLPFAEKVKGEWLKQLAKRQQWDKFFQVYQRYSNEDIAVLCLALNGRIAQNDSLAMVASD
ncbi:MAG: hypothetical protein ACKN9H_05615 [Methylophilaceae bacterium]